MPRALDESWSDYQLHKYCNKIIEACLGLKAMVSRMLNVGSHRHIYQFSYRALNRIFHAISCYQSPRRDISSTEMARLWASEAYRALVDRVQDR